jgi:hypothetical protein
MRFTVEPSPAGGWHVKLAGHDAPVSRERVTLRVGSRIVCAAAGDVAPR